MLEDQPPWSYSKRAAELMHQAFSVFDLGTHGELLVAMGERVPDEEELETLAREAESL